MRKLRRICCFAMAFVMLFSLAATASETQAAAAHTKVTAGGTAPRANGDLVIVPSDAIIRLGHYSFSNAFCAAYVYAGSTVSTKVELYDRNSLQSGPIDADISGEVSFSSSDESVCYIDENNRIVAVSEGTALLSALLYGEHVDFLDDAGYIQNALTVEVMATPSLSYDRDSSGNILVDYGLFNSNLTLYYKGEKDELWTMGNREADGIYTHYYPDPTETYTYVMRYYDDICDTYAEVGEALVVEPEIIRPTPTVIPLPTPTVIPLPTPTRIPVPTPTLMPLPTPTAIPVPTVVPVPTAAPGPVPVELPDIPDLSSEPSAEQVRAAIEAVKEACPKGTAWPDSCSYPWHGGSFGKEGLKVGMGNVAFTMAVSDCIFGSLPAAVIKTDVDNLRPGDILVTDTMDSYIITHVAREYVVFAGVEKGRVFWSQPFPTEQLKESFIYAVSRYESASPGASAQTPSIIPVGVKILSSGDASVKVYKDYVSILKWALTADGSLYLWGWGQTTPGDIPEPWESLKGQIKRVVIGPNIPAVGWSDFDNCENLEEAVLGKDVKSIDVRAFENCTSLKKINLENITEIGDKAFYGCAFETLELPEGLEKLGERAFEYNEKLRRLSLPTGISEMGVEAFSDCVALEELVLPEGLKVLSYGAFSNAESLKEVSVPGSVKALPDNIFSSCGSIETVYVSDGVESIGENSFYLCYALKEVHFPNSLQSIGSCAFDHCDNVSDVYFYGTETQWNNVEIGTNNTFLELFAIKHFEDPGACRHQNVSITEAIEPSCTKGGMSEGKICADCGEILEKPKSIAALGHLWDEGRVTREPTEETEGEKLFSCTRCGEEKRENIAKLPSKEPVPEPIENPFTDVRDSDYFFEPVRWAVERNVTTGLSATSFGPGAVCTRAQVVTFLWRAAGEPTPQSSDNPFADVSESAYYYDAVLWAVENGITTGLSKTSFGPNAPCNRAQVVTFLWRAADKPAAGSNANPFYDVKDGDYFLDAVLWAVENGITTGLSQSSFGPSSPCNRGQIVTFLYRSYN